MQSKQVVSIVGFCFFLFIVGTLFAGTTGKISGVVVDSETKEPLPGVNIVVEGTTMGAATDVNGQYMILNIPPGVYALKAMMIGYTSQTIQNILVKIDLTTKINFSLTTTVLGGEEVTVVAEREIVQMDMTSSLAAVGAEEIEALPLQSIDQVLDLQAGVVQSGGEFHVRGGRGGEITYMVDGVTITSLDGSRGVNVESDAVQEMQLISGTFNAEYGNAMSAILNIVTKEGDDKYSGQIQGSLGDYVSSNHIYDVMTGFKPVINPVSNNPVMVDEAENPLTGLNPQYDIRGTLSGPVPFLGNKMNFFVNGRYISETGYLYGRKWFTPQGLAGDSSLVPLQPVKSTTMQAKLTYRPFTNIKLNYNVFWRSSERERNASKDLKYVPDAGMQRYNNGITHMINLSHTLSANTFYEVKLSQYYSHSEQYLYEDPYIVPDYFIRLYKTVDDNTEIEDRYYTSDAEKEAIINEAKEKEWTWDFIIDPNNSVGYLHPDSNRTNTAQNSFDHIGTNLDHNYSTDKFLLGKFDLTSQVSNTHQIKAGFEGTLHEIQRESYTLRPKRDANGNEIVPFVPVIEPVSSLWHDNYTRKPKEFSAYVQDKMEYKDMIMNIGLRFDYFDPNYVVPVDPTDPDIYKPFSSEFIGANWDAQYYKNLPTQAEKDAYEAANAYTPEQRRDLMHKKVKAKTQISPRVGIAYPISDKGVIHFSYGHFFQMPSASYLYSRPDFKLAEGTPIFGNADLNAEKTVQYEIGLQQQIGENVGIDVTLFYKDIRDWIGVSTIYNTQFLNINYVKYENKDYANVRGITVTIDRRYANNLSASLDYTFQIAEGTYTSPNEAYSAAQGNEEPAKKLIYMDYDRRHSLNATVAYNLLGWTIAVIGKYNTGFPYTPNFIAGNANANYRGWRENIARNPATSMIDLKIDKRLVKTGPLSHRLFIRVYNLLDQKGALRVHADTGSPEYTTYGTHRWVSYDRDRIGSLEHFYLNPEFYQSPRQIQLGYIIEF
ncbi:TonB-dependent receptor [candidate division KSB1 bacterium]|nr:TonB-dependent receptor [candidate division KSB1 bacterium]